MYFESTKSRKFRSRSEADLYVIRRWQVDMKNTEQNSEPTAVIGPRRAACASAKPTIFSLQPYSLIGGNVHRLWNNICRIEEAIRTSEGIGH